MERRNLRRFSLVEIMIVVAIIGILMAMAVPSYVHARYESRKRTCIANLKEMDEVKSVWALENKKETGDPVTFGDLVPTYLKTTPVCPSGGKYTLGAVGVTPTCSIDGHRLESASASAAPSPRPTPKPIPPPVPRPWPRPIGPPVPAPTGPPGLTGGGKEGKGKGSGKRKGSGRYNGKRKKNGKNGKGAGKGKTGKVTTGRTGVVLPGGRPLPRINPF